MAKSTLITTIDIGSQTVAGARFQADPSGGVILQGHAFEAMDGDTTLDSAKISQTALALDGVTQQLGVSKGEGCRYSISGQSVFTRFVKIPAVSEDKIDEMVRFEAQQHVPFPIDEVAWDYQVFGETADGDLEVGLFAIKLDQLNSLNGVVEDAKLVVNGVGVDAMALYNAYRYNYPDVDEPVLLVDIGSRSTNLLYIEGGSLFARTIAVGGASVTSAIAKDLGVTFQVAEQQKIQDGYVALGGAYEENPDPRIDAISKIVRTTMTRLHSEIVRTNNFYRTQQGGTVPKRVLLAGGGASLPYTIEFLHDKLGAQVEYFNAMRNVAVGPQVDAAAVSAVGHRMGELVGLALGQAGGVPVDVDLVPATVAARREIAARKPFLTTAAVCVLAALGAGAVYQQMAASKLEDKAGEFSAVGKVVDGNKRDLSVLDDQISEIDVNRGPVMRIFEMRDRWVGIIDELNRQFASDIIWVTDLEPLAGGTGVRDFGALKERTAVGEELEFDEEDGGKPRPDVVTEIRIKGFWRNAPAGQNQINQIYDRLRESKTGPLVLAEVPPQEKAKRLKVSSRNDDDYAWAFEMTLPLAEPILLR
ncbi:Amuc_1101 family PilM-like pilus complex protein [Sulfuriroseicoccus oceanibius]|uniref:Pilus assembly protein PilM n=1 Tax=Sulfuriroseicoccus oceanibius TaxID=2707525 RepID=A0A6B3L410_9BACT|nr:pilus assembly protein PilM [Sulfuriroseicoccus oceanibius]QQL44517.1 pilus assembly protein PilM [Sulfuriroseicoccus oceanibius]